MELQDTKLGAFLGLVGSMILLMVGLTRMADARFLIPVDTSYPVMLPYMQAGSTIVFSIIGIFGTVLAFRNNVFGYPCLLVAGIIGIVGTFIPIFISIAGGIITEIGFLNHNLLYVDVVFILMGGILGLALPQKKGQMKIRLCKTFCEFNSNIF